eukprot:13722892-Ditylum_brightwellii.AAC.1
MGILADVVEVRIKTETEVDRELEVGIVVAEVESEVGSKTETGEVTGITREESSSLINFKRAAPFTFGYK